MPKLVNWLKWQIPGRWKGVKRFFYKRGYRPKPGNPLYSRGLNWYYTLPTRREVELGQQQAIYQKLDRELKKLEDRNG